MVAFKRRHAICIVGINKYNHQCYSCVYIRVTSNLFIETCMRDFKKRCHDSFPMVMFGAIVVGIRGQYKNAGNEKNFKWLL